MVVVKKLGVALALLALMEPAAAGVKFADEALWRLYERWLAHFNEVVDCDNNGHGCKGGNRNSALDYIAKKGISSEADYPYTATNGTCQASSKPRVDLNFQGYQTVPPYDEFELLTAVGYGPVAVAISVGDNNLDFRYYEEGDGVYNGRCTRDTRHAVLLVGYTADSYIIKNS
ncbi:hypothetical protein EJB05_08217, partial [Eragrostis curvula]